MRFDAKTRAKALEAGWWQRHDNSLIKVTEMPDGYLLNSLLKSLEDDAPCVITHPLAAEVIRRGLERTAMTRAAARMRRLVA
jgi:hypothetical protein